VKLLQLTQGIHSPEFRLAVCVCVFLLDLEEDGKYQTGCVYFGGL